MVGHATEKYLVATIQGNVVLNLNLIDWVGSKLADNTQGHMHTLYIGYKNHNKLKLYLI